MSQIGSEKIPAGALIFYRFEHQDMPGVLVFADSGHLQEVRKNLGCVRLETSWKMAEAYSEMLENIYHVPFELVGYKAFEKNIYDEIFKAAKENSYDVYALLEDNLVSVKSPDQLNF